MRSRVIAAGIGVVLGLLLAAYAYAEQPYCTGDRHYDGVACCPVVDPPATTTTTLVAHVEDGCPAGCIATTDIPECPDVTCGSGTTVTINRCPVVSFPAYQPCGLDHHGRRHCGTRSRPHRILVPMVGK